MEKDNYISTVKALGIILMVIGHAIGPNIACRFIYMFHMPLFFFCSGYFFRTPIFVEDLGRFAIKRFQGLYLPFVKWSILFLLFHNIFCTWGLYDASLYGYYNISDYFIRMKSLLFTMTGQEQLLDPFWFLKELLIASLLICLIKFALRKVNYMYLDAFLLFLLIVMTVVTKPGDLGLPIIWNLSIMFLSATFVFAGYLYRKIEKLNCYSYSGFLFSFLILALAVWSWNDSLDMLWYNAVSVLFFIPSALVGIYMTFSASYLIERYSYKKVLYYIGQNTLTILTWHLLVFKFVSLLKIYFYELPIDKLAEKGTISEHNEFFWILYTLFGITVPLVCKEIFQKIRLKNFVIRL